MNEKTGISGGMTRREAVRAGLGATAALWAGQVPGLGALAAPEAPPLVEKAKAVIQIWMWGGPSHLDTFDPKPEAGYDYYGAYKQPLATTVDGVFIGEKLPLLARQADKYSLLRGMTHGNNGHETASYMVQTGRPTGGGTVYPSLGAVVSYFKGHNAGYDGPLPPYVVLTQPQGRFSECGFLGPKYKPFATGGDPSKTPFAVEGIIAPGISRQRQEERKRLLLGLDRLPKTHADNPLMTTHMAHREEAYDLILGKGAAIFDLAGEPEELRTRYGRNTFGQSCLMARRLVENGVRYITINYKGWDTHKQHFPTMNRKLPEMDQGLATLLQDLADRGLLDSTIVWWGGEFGRTPKVQWESPWNGGRGHYGKAFSALVAGGGFAGGRVVGATDKTGENVVERKIYPWDLMASIYTQLGIDPRATLPHGETPVRLTLTAEDKVETGGLLKEIMS